MDFLQTLRTFFTPEWAMVLFTVMLCFFTRILAKYTKLLYSETKKARELQETPDITVTIEPMAGELCLCIMNQGKASAYGIVIQADQNIPVKPGDKSIPINELTLMHLSFLRVGQFFVSALGCYKDLITKFPDNTNTKLTFSIDFINEKGFHYNKNSTIDIKELGHGTPFISTSSARTLEKVYYCPTSFPCNTYTTRKTK